jgi:hypothetical protein
MIITIPDLGNGGVIKDQKPHELPLSVVSDALNVRFSSSGAEKISGETAVYTTPLIAPYHLELYANNTYKYVVYAGLDYVYIDGPGQIDITGTTPTGGIDDKWTGGTLNGVLVLNNGVDAPMFWGGNTANNLATLTDWTAGHLCKTLRPWKNYLIAGNVTKGSDVYPHMVKWSAAADPGAIPSSWDETDPTTDAGEQDLSETTDVIVDSLPLGDANIVYKTASMYAQTYIGGQYIFSFRRLPGDVGMLASNCGAVTPLGHVVLSAGDLILHNGQGPQSILTGAMRTWLYSNLDATNYERSFVVANNAKDEVWVCFPGSGSATCNYALIWNWINKTFTIRELDNVTCGVSGQLNPTSTSELWSDSGNWDEETKDWDESVLPLSQSRLLLGSTSLALLATDLGSQFTGTNYTSRIERTGLAFDDNARVKLIRAVYPRLDGTTGATVYVQVGGAMDAESEYTWSDPVPYTIGTTYKVDTFASGRYLAYRLYSTDSLSWRCKSIDFDIVPVGGY